MSPIEQYITQTRRDFLATSSCGLGTLALASLLKQDGLLAEEASIPANPLATRVSHFAPKAERCIFIFLEGGPSQMDLFDPKPLLNKYDGQPLPDSIVGDAKFAFLQKESATVMGTSRVFNNPFFPRPRSGPMALSGASRRKQSPSSPKAYNYMKINTLKNRWTLPALACATLALTFQSNAAVTVTFAQVGSDVVATWSGSLDPGTFFADTTVAVPYSEGSSTGLIGVLPGSYAFASG